MTWTTSYALDDRHVGGTYLDHASKQTPKTQNDLRHFLKIAQIWGIPHHIVRAAGSDGCSMFTVVHLSMPRSASRDYDDNKPWNQTITAKSKV